MPDFSELAANFERLLRPINHGTTSTTKYREFERYLGESLGIPVRDIYTTTVDKPGNFDVRMTQSVRARDARLRVALLPHPHDLADVRRLAARIARDRDPGSGVLLVCDEPTGWTPRWAVEPENSGFLSANTSGWVGFDYRYTEEFELYTYSRPPAEPLTEGQTELFTTPSAGEPAVSRDLERQILSARPQVTEWLYQQEPLQFARLIESDLAARDVIAIAHRRSVVERFRNLLNDPEFFKDAAEPFGGRPEKVWQDLLEENPWILGVSLAGQLLTNLSRDKLEQVVAGFSIAGPGKRADAVMRTNGRIRAMVIAEIKHHETALVGREYRPGSWAPSPELSGAVVQVQQTINLAARKIDGRFAETDDSDAETGEHTYFVRPRSFLILGHLDQLRGTGGVHRTKYESFELYRRNLYEPEILTFDELLARAEWHVEAPGDSADTVSDSADTAST